MRRSLNMFHFNTVAVKIGNAMKCSSLKMLELVSEFGRQNFRFHESTKIVNKLNLKLQGKGKLITDCCEDVQAFVTKLDKLDNVLKIFICSFDFVIEEAPENLQLKLMDFQQVQGRNICFVEAISFKFTATCYKIVD